MKKQLRLWIQQLISWCQAKRKPLMVIIAIILLVGFIVSLVGGYWLQWSWTGFAGQGNPTGKTLWDWMQLLIIPAVLTIGGYAFNVLTGRNEQRRTQLQDQTERDIASDNQREAALQDYIDKMSDLLLNNRLRDSSEDEEVRQIARIRTLTVLRRLDAERKGNVIQFLQGASLIKEEEAILDLARADLSYADLNYADLRRANLRRANLRRANLSGALLIGALLIRTDLSYADLSYADLRRADLSGALLIGVDLRRAKIAQEQLEKAESLQGAIMPDGSNHP